MNSSLVLQATYDAIEFGIAQNGQLIDTASVDKTKSSSLLINSIDLMLKKHHLRIQNLSFIAANRGPAPFTTLRVALATVNGISFASAIPLIGVDGLRAFVHQESSPEYPATAYLFNAFNQDVYYALEMPNHDLIIGCASIDETLQKIKDFNQPCWRFVGNGALLYKGKILQTFDGSYFPEPMPLYASLDAIAKTAYENQTVTNQLLPLYLKETHYRPSIK